MSLESFFNETREQENEKTEKIDNRPSNFDTFNPDERIRPIDTKVINPWSDHDDVQVVHRPDFFSPKYIIDEPGMKFNPDKRVNLKLDEIKYESKFFTDKEDRINHAKHSEGTWSDKPGQSKFYPDDQEVKDILEEEGQECIEYNEDGFPDFSTIAKETTQIDKMVENRDCNFKKADKQTAEKWNLEAKDEKTDWTAADVKQYRHDQKLTWHEKEDTKTMELVPTKVHDACKHYGGIAEVKAQNHTKGGGFDE